MCLTNIIEVFGRPKITTSVFLLIFFKSVTVLNFSGFKGTEIRVFLAQQMKNVVFAEDKPQKKHKQCELCWIQYDRDCSDVHKKMIRSFGGQ